MKRKSMIDFGLTSETLFDIDLAMPYWLQMGHQEFLMSVIHELREHLVTGNFFLKEIAEDEQLGDQPVARWANGKTVREVCEIIKQHNDRASGILNLMWEYSLQAMQSDEQQGESKE